MNRETNNTIAVIGIFVIAAIMMMPVDHGRVAADIESMGPGVASHFSECPRVNFGIQQAGGVLPYYRQQTLAKRDWQNSYYADRKDEYRRRNY